ncbi:TPA: hypothetical protein NK304_001799 [Vibrio parahaemolyticus]|uniref:hypothetical protein n=1 Tax=Vibrio harveyi group TaxID=717610 RepID=UPI000406F509|nr:MULTISPECIES: hypothetical protein [Vibrio harveyi group]EGR3373988.1 hypothetical protein [Vibrio parahaemolyticus]EGR3418940.1 hypothetical protein [Vibrio parahaemolyticus]EHH1256576.1 hypothetical protein [Vibrio parahaemolyticus]EJG2368875.1 hypothetical protein [Vibrio parahaemolyticus]MBE3814181.1 hypothetical protein [Vibrio parahaemolyticus]
MFEFIGIIVVIYFMWKIGKKIIVQKTNALTIERATKAAKSWGVSEEKFVEITTQPQFYNCIKFAEWLQTQPIFKHMLWGDVLGYATAAREITKNYPLAEEEPGSSKVVVLAWNLLRYHVLKDTRYAFNIWRLRNGHLPFAQYTDYTTIDDEWLNIALELNDGRAYWAESFGIHYRLAHGRPLDEDTKEKEQQLLEIAASLGHEEAIEHLHYCKMTGYFDND